jgi:integrase
MSVRIVGLGSSRRARTLTHGPPPTHRRVVPLPCDRLHTDHVTGQRRRNHLHTPPGGRLPRPHQPSRNCGHRSVKTTMIYTHVLDRGAGGVASPLDRLV